MKKLMIAAAIVCVAAFAQAANYQWTSGSTLYTWDSADPDWPVMAGCNAYLVFADAYSEDALVSDFNAGTVDFTALNASGGTTTVTSGGLVTPPVAASADYTSAVQAYFAVIDGDTLFVSGEVEAPYNALTYGGVTFKYDQVEGVWTGEARFDASEGFVGAGYYTPGTPEPTPTPEPTSGLLMLVGLAGLALRRRRA